ncbi:DEAD/DEAH box helicase family protein [Chryseobacterium cucumeris]|uniref:DEAD/DEAH box helicase n=1 Tax=Chryseobacterium cucumeris TaxID=1813611 RepID=UPI00320A9562
MKYFSINYSNIKINIDKNGLRNAQIGAIHAICSHFTLKENPALVVLPTGTGKTAVIVMCPYLLQAKRVLVLSSSVLVRGQIVDEFTTLKTLKEREVIDDNINCPNVLEIKSPLETTEQWQNLENYDVVVGIPSTIYSELNSIIPNKDLFDLILVDEAHHAPAETWKGILNYFSNAKQILFTATPFRRDKKEVPGKLIYNYPLSKAKDDKVFGEVEYYSITTSSNVTTEVDKLIAVKTEEVFKKDREDGFEHYLIVRTDKKEHAKELIKIYEKNTNLKIRRIDSNQTYNYIKNTIKALREKKLDGIVCVNMLGEGFDFPNLKIAAIHKPHKSLAITLQFIGRFARTNAKNIDKAKFIATTHDFKLGTSQLFKEGSIWDNMIVDLSQNRIRTEDEVKEFVEKYDIFENKELSNSELSLYDLNPYFHVKIYSTNDFILNENFQIPRQETLYKFMNEENNSIIFITRELNKPKWLNSDDLVNIEYFVYMIYYSEDQNLLFIHSSIRTKQFYDYISSSFTNQKPELVPKRNINKVLANLTEIDFFNIGMLNKAMGSGESYRTITGSSTQNTIKKSDGRLYSNGHIFAKAINETDKQITIGYSSGSKIWSNTYLKINEFITFCNEIGKKINSDLIVNTNSGFDNLPIGQYINEFPLKVFAIQWDEYSLRKQPRLYKISDAGEILNEYSFLDFDIEIIRQNKYEINLSLKNVEDEILITYSLIQHFTYSKDVPYHYQVDNTELINYLNENSLQFYLIDLSCVVNHEYHPIPKEGDLHYDKNLIEVFDWNRYNTNIQKEFYDINEKQTGDKNSIHESIEEHLKNVNYDIVIYDHGTGEVADHITISNNSNIIEVELYHAKKSGGTSAGDRVNDVYDVCGQAVKSLIWTTTKLVFHNKIIARLRDTDTTFIKGDENILNNLLVQPKPISFVINIVQPGISKNNLTEKISTVLASTETYIESKNSSKFKVIASE